MADTNLSKLNQKTLRVPRDHTYTYYTNSASRGKPTLILFHGWPDTAKLWANVINNYLLPSGYGIIAVDGLGFGDTSEPTDAVAILDAEQIPTVISVGHDWGSGIAQRLYNCYPTRVSGLGMLNFAAALDALRKVFGYGTIEYWKFFVAEDAPWILSENIKSIYAAAHGSPESWLETYCAPDGMRNWVSSGKTQQPLQPYAGGSHEADFLVLQENVVVKVPTLFWGGTRDMVCRPEMLQRSMEAGLLPKLTLKLVDEGHWALLAKPERFSEDLIQ
ncbi:Alpha/Beta hydrolase protein [Leptodontidium sp. 2 PMI_412]|nr:Alpha/Beta hydrolase protein [Leptodontidium sp. 2 PMI_412]